MKQFICVISFIFVFSTSASMAEETQVQQNIQQTLNLLKSALNQHDFDMLKPYLSTDFSFNGYDGDMGHMIMRQIVMQYPRTIESIMIQEFVETDQQFIVSTVLNFQNEKETKELILSRDFKIVQAPIVHIQMAGHKESSDSKKPMTISKDDKIPAKMIVPFELAERLIVVEAEIEGVRGNFFVDSGAPSLMLNAKRFPGLVNIAESIDVPVHGAGGAIKDAKRVEASGFKWQEIDLTSVNALLNDLSHLEKNTNTEIVGLIGADFLHNFTIKFDYARKELTLFSKDPTDSWQTAPNHVFDLEMIGHIPVIDVKIDNHVLRFGIDSGAGGAMLFTKWEEPLKPHYEFLRRDAVTGGDTNIQMGNTVRLDAFEVGNLQYENHTFRFNDLIFGHELKMDGLLGYEFLSHYKTAIDFQNRKLYVWTAVNH